MAAAATDPAEDAKVHITAVLTVLREAVSDGEMKHVWSQLPKDFATHFGVEAPKKRAA